MRPGCIFTIIVAILILGMGAGAIWTGSRFLQEPEISAKNGTQADGLRGQQKIFEIARGESGRSRGSTRRVTLTESELNGFLSRHLEEAARIPVVTGAVRLVGDGVVELKGRLPLQDVLAARPLTLVTDLLPTPWLERPVWLHLWARATFEVGTARGQRRYLRLDVERFALGCQPLPETLLRALLSPAALGLLRWRLPDTVEGISIEPGTVVVKVAS